MGHPERNKTPTVLVLGGYGFIGRYTVTALKRYTAHVLIGTRGQRINFEKAKHERQVRLHHCQTAENWKSVLTGVDVVINTVGILRERRGETFDAVHHRATGALAKACRNHGIALVHVSALGINGPVYSEFSSSKLLGESAILKSGCCGAIVRASVVDAPDGYGSGWFHRLAQWPVWLLPAQATRLLSPITATDLGTALARLAIQKATNGDPGQSAGIIEVGCGETFTLEDYLAKLRRVDSLRLAKPVLIFRIPEQVAKFSARLFDYLNLTPYSIGHHELLKFDNIPYANQLPEILGHPPTPIGSVTGKPITTNTSAPAANQKFDQWNTRIR